MTSLVAEVRARLAAATPGPWCYESVGEKGDGANIVGVAYGPEDQNCERPLQGRVRPYTDTGEEADIYRDEQVAVCEHRNRRPDADAALIAAAPTDLARLCDRVEELERALELWGRFIVTSARGDFNLALTATMTALEKKP